MSQMKPSDEAVLCAGGWFGMSGVGPTPALVDILATEILRLHRLTEQSGGPEGDGWIPVTERIPEKFDRYMAANINDGSVGVALFYSTKKFDWQFREVTHWKPMPAGPSPYATPEQQA